MYYVGEIVVRQAAAPFKFWTLCIKLHPIKSNPNLVNLYCLYTNEGKNKKKNNVCYSYLINFVLLLDGPQNNLRLQLW